MKTGVSKKWSFDGLYTLYLPGAQSTVSEPRVSLPPSLLPSLPLPIPSPLTIFFLSLFTSLLHPPLFCFVPRQVLTSWWQNGCQQLQVSIPLAPERESPPSHDFYGNPGPTLIVTDLATGPALSQLLWPKGLELLSHMLPPSLG